MDDLDAYHEDLFLNNPVMRVPTKNQQQLESPDFRSPFRFDEYYGDSAKKNDGVLPYGDDPGENDEALSGGGGGDDDLLEKNDEVLSGGGGGGYDLLEKNDEALSGGGGGGDDDDDLLEKNDEAVSGGDVVEENEEILFGKCLDYISC